MRTMIISSIIVLFAGISAFAGDRPAGYYGLGPRLGVTSNPDQVHFGMHLDLGELTPNLMMVPNLEVGLGDHVTSIAPSFELDYRFRSSWGVWSPYAGGGIGPVFYSVDNYGSETDAGFYVQGGIMKGFVGRNSGYFFIEAKLGLIDAPDAKFTVGWTFAQ